MLLMQRGKKFVRNVRFFFSSTVFVASHITNLLVVKILGVFFCGKQLHKNTAVTELHKTLLKIQEASKDLKEYWDICIQA